MKKIITLLLAVTLAFGAAAQNDTLRTNAETRTAIESLIMNSEIKIVPEAMAKMFTAMIPLAFQGDTVEKYNLTEAVDMYGREAMLNSFLETDSIYIVFADSFKTNEIELINSFYKSSIGERYTKELCESGLLVMVAKATVIEKLQVGEDPGENILWQTLTLQELKEIAKTMNTDLFKRLENTMNRCMISFAHEMQKAKDPNSIFGKNIRMMFENIGKYLNEKGCKIDMVNDKRFKL